METKHDHETWARRDAVDGRRRRALALANGNGHATNGNGASAAASPTSSPLAESARREAVLAIGQAGLEGLPVTELTQRAVGLVVEQLGLDFCQLWELLPSGREFLLRAGSGWAPAAVGSLRLGVDASDQPGFTLAAPAPVVIADFEHEQRFHPPRYLAERGVRSGLSVRIPGPRPGFGVISGHTLEPRCFTPKDASFLGAVAQVLGTAIDRRRSEERLREAEARYREIIERLPAVAYLAEYGAEGRWLYVSPQIERLLGYTAEEWMADPKLWLERVHPDDRAWVIAEEERCAVDESFEAEYRMRARDGRLLWVRDEAAVGHTGDGGAIQVEGVLIDITRQKLAEREFRRRAEHDELTGLYNRRRFEEGVADFRAANPSGRGAVVVMDVDQLKFVNDSLGHAAGDSLLRSVAESLHASLRPGESVGRLGGDEFAVFLPDVDKRAAAARAAKLIRVVRSSWARHPQTASAGFVAFESASSATTEDLLIAADIALYDAKGAGGDRVASVSDRAQGRLAWVGKVREAIDGDRLVLHGQPIVDLRSGELVAEELLVRMLDDQGELVYPGSFLPTAERFGLIREIDRWVVANAIAIAAGGRNVTVNLSARSVADRSLLALVAGELERSGADPDRIVFEITETAAATATDELHEFAAEVERLGCGLAIDDFGTGFGSFTYLKHLRARLLKIDIEFVRELRSSEADRRIVRAIVTIAEAFGIETVAEGVEDEETLELLRELGVSCAQGYHLGRPAPLA